MASVQIDIDVEFPIGSKVILAVTKERVGLVDALTVTGLDHERVRYSVQWDNLQNTWHYDYELVAHSETPVGFVK